LFSVARLKRLSASEPYYPRDSDEIRGQLKAVFCRNGSAIALFEWGKVAFPEELCEKLTGLIGRNCAILRLDGKYYCREAS
jgi:hypothetical protein